MGNNIYSRNEYMIIQMSRGFIVINRNKRFEEGHTHIRNFKTAKMLIGLAIRKSAPCHLPPYLLISLSRITEDDDFRTKMLELAEVKKNKKQKYVNK